MKTYSDIFVWSQFGNIAGAITYSQAAYLTKFAAEEILLCQRLRRTKTSYARGFGGERRNVEQESRRDGIAVNPKNPGQTPASAVGMAYKKPRRGVTLVRVAITHRMGINALTGLRSGKP
ncbi:MAG: hypothetical protein RIE86_12525 [Imperialibacter sp.]|uniref:hypothetical protein n=1 Tax=Imperialibacter sp. TaxID=2038411 RepID=UPI0032EDE8F8